MLTTKNEDSSVNTEEDTSRRSDGENNKLSEGNGKAKLPATVLEARHNESKSAETDTVANTDSDQNSKVKSDASTTDNKSNREEIKIDAAKAGDKENQASENVLTEDIWDAGNKDEDDDTKEANQVLAMKAPLHRLMADYKERKEQFMDAKMKRAESARKSARPKKAPDKFVAEPGSIFLNPLAFKMKRKKRLRMKKKELQQQQKLKKALELKQATNQKPAAFSASETAVSKSSTACLSATFASEGNAPRAAKNTTAVKREFPEELMMMLASQAAPESLWWIPQSKGKAFAVDVVRKHYANPFGLIAKSLRQWGFRKTYIHQLPEGMIAYEHSHFQRKQPELVKLLKLPDVPKPRRRLVAHCPLHRNTSGVKIQQNHPGVVSSDSFSEQKAEYLDGLAPSQRIVLLRGGSNETNRETTSSQEPEHRSATDATRYRPRIAPIMLEMDPRTGAGHSVKKRKIDSRHSGQTMSKRCRMVQDCWNQQAPTMRPPAHWCKVSAKEQAANNIANRAECVRYGKMSRIDAVRADWEQQDRDTHREALNAARGRRQPPNLHPFSMEQQNPVNMARVELDQRARNESEHRFRQAAFMAAAAKQQEEERAVKRKTMALQEEIARSRQRIVEREKLMQVKVAVDQEAARRQRLSAALFGSNSTAKRIVKKTPELVAPAKRGGGAPARSRGPADRTAPVTPRQNSALKTIRRAPVAPPPNTTAFRYPAHFAPNVDPLAILQQQLFGFPQRPLGGVSNLDLEQLLLLQQRFQR